MRTRTLLLLAVASTVLPVWLAAVAAGGGATASGVRAAPTPPGTHSGAIALLRAWDRRRSDAWAHGDPASLTALYLPGSRTGGRDVAELRQWRRRGLRVIGLRQQVTAIRLTGRGPGRMTMVVTERTVDGVAVGRHRRTALPVSAWAAHRISWRRRHGTWLVAEVQAQPAR